MLAQGAAGTDDVGDRVGDPELDGDFDGAVEPHDRGVDSAGVEVVPDQVGIRRRDPESGEVLDLPVLARRGGVPKRGPAEAEREPLADGGAGVAGEVTAGDAQVELTGSDVDRDVIGPQKEELNRVGGSRTVRSRESVRRR